MAFGFFQMAGYNRYEETLGGKGARPYINVLKDLDANDWTPRGPVRLKPRRRRGAGRCALRRPPLVFLAAPPRAAWPTPPPSPSCS